VRVRTNGWCECLIHRGAERWIGHGLDEDDALSDAVTRMLPSELGRVLLARFSGAEPQPVAAEAPPPVADGELAPLPEIAETITTAAAPTDTEEAATTITEESIQAEPEPELGHDTTADTGAPVPEATVSPAPVPAPQPAAPPAPAAAPPPREEIAERPARPRTSDALEAVEKLLAGIEDRLGSLARMCADRQRLHMLVWICRARAVEESLPGVRDVEHAVARVARRLTEIGKMFWPGSVRALQLSARPSDVRREMHANWASDPTNWVEATALAERLLAEHLQKSHDAGFDEDGWADGAARTPRPADPDALFEEVAAELKAMLIPPGEVPNGRLGELTSAELEALITAARKLRWLRGAVKDDLSWGIAMGRLRRSIPSLGERATRVRDVLDNRYKPQQPWAKLLGDAEGPDSNVQERPDKLLADLPAAGESKEALMAWLIRAFDVLNTPDLVSKLGPLKAQIGNFTEEELNHSDRRVRRRLRDLVKRIGEVDAAPPPKEAAKEPEPEAEEPAADEPLAASALDALGARVRQQTKGSRALFVSNREDPELGARLSEMLGISITWCDGSLRRVQAQCERITRGSYDLVLSATGFQVHGVDSALARASSAAGIPYVRVNRGRPVACVQAIAREFGLTSQTIATSVQAKASC
jgi:hypothetical protein